MPLVVDTSCLKHQVQHAMVSEIGGWNLVCFFHMQQHSLRKKVLITTYFFSTTIDKQELLTIKLLKNILNILSLIKLSCGILATCYFQ